VWRFDTNKDKLDPKPWATGLTAVTGCGFGTDGAFYATEFSTLGLDHAAPSTGAVVRVPANSTSPITVVSGLSFPNGFAASDDALYVSNWSTSPAVIPPGGPPFQPGEVVRIGLPD
jgi:sugar lactone lactonase YvrE